MTENKTKITIAIIGLIGILGGAFFANWDKIFQPSPEPLPSPAPTPTPPENGEYKHKPPPEPPPKEPHHDFSQQLENLQRELERIDRKQMKAHKEIDRLIPFLETDRDAPQAIENQERWLEELEENRGDVQREIDHLREQQ